MSSETKQKIKTFRSLKVWQKAHLLTLDVYSVTGSFPQGERFGLVTQLRRAVSSVCANLAEGHLKSTKDFLRYIDISRGSLEETKYFLILSHDLNYLDSQRFTLLFQKAEEVSKMLAGLRKKLRLNQ